MRWQKMRKRQTFLITILSSETRDASFCGQLKRISSGKSTNFTSLEELYSLITLEMETEEEQISSNSHLQYLAPRDALAAS
jgi:hypothetical protein